MTKIDQLAPLLDAVTGGAYSLALASGKASPAGPEAVVYGPGRGLWHEGRWLLTRGPGKVGASASQASGRQVPSLHCSSWTALLAGFAVGRDAGWDHRGTLVPLNTLLEQERGERNGAKWRGYGGCFVRVHGDGEAIRSGAMKGCTVLKGQAVVDTLVSQAGKGGALYLAAQSTKGATSWVWWHHTLALIVHPSHPDRIFRVAADGSQSSAGYSGTPMDVEVWGPGGVTPNPTKTCYVAWRLRDDCLTPSGARVDLEA